MLEWKLIAEHNRIHLIYSQLQTVDIADTHSTIKFYACNPSITTREGTFGLTPICTKTDKQNLSNRLEQKLTQSEL